MVTALASHSLLTYLLTTLLKCNQSTDLTNERWKINSVDPSGADAVLWDRPGLDAHKYPKCTGGESLAHERPIASLV